MDVSQHIGLVKSIVTRMGVARSHRDDAVQEGCLALITAAPHFDPARAAWSTFATRCVTNAVRNMRRGERRHDARVRGIVDSTREQDISCSPPEVPANMQRALDALDSRVREIVLLRVVEGWTLEAVASKIGLGKSRVAVLEREGLDKMRGLV